MRTAARSAALLSTLWLVIAMVRGGIPWTPSLFVALAALWTLHVGAFAALAKTLEKRLALVRPGARR